MESFNLFELDRWDEVENCHKKNNWKVIFKTEFNKAELVWLFTSKNISYKDKNSETHSELLRKCFKFEKHYISTHATLDQGLCQGLLLVFLQFD